VLDSALVLDSGFTETAASRQNLIDGRFKS
jgi:hypothetical protein